MGTKIQQVDFADWLRDEMYQRGLSQADLVRKGGISKAQVSRTINRETAPTFEFCRRVARALGVAEIEVFHAAGLVEPEPTQGQTKGDSILDRLFRLVAGLSREDKQDLLDLAEAKLERRRRRGG